MAYPYSHFTVHPPDQPDLVVKVKAMDGKRGAARKGRMVLINMGELSPDVKPDSLVVREIR